MNKNNTAQQKSDLENRINHARLAGACKNYTLTEFKNYILELGLTKYVKSILPAEQGDYSRAITGYPQTERKAQAEEPACGAKIIPFPGVTLSDHFQNEVDDFLREMGYIE